MRVTRRDAMGHPTTIEVTPGDLVQVDDVIMVRESWF
jgi:polysaccharide export outer membrane protein